MPRKDTERIIQEAAKRLTGGSVTALLNAAVADYLPRALGDELPEVLAAGRSDEKHS